VRIHKEGDLRAAVTSPRLIVGRCPWVTGLAESDSRISAGLYGMRGGTSASPRSSFHQHECGPFGVERGAPRADTPLHGRGDGATVP